MRKERILILATSGAGLGHLTRAMAIARELRKREDNIEIIFVTSSNALELIRQEGFLFYYIPSRLGTSRQIKDVEWTYMVESFFREIVIYYKPKAVIYDVAYPYRMIYKVLEEEGVSKTVWIKRECYKEGLEYINEFEKEFGLVIMPRELPSQREYDTIKKKYVDPIVLLSREELYDRDYVRRKYGIKKRDRAVYIQLGLGMLCDTSEKTKEVIREVQRRRRVHLLLGNCCRGSALCMKCSRWNVLGDYPVFQYFNGVDLSITAAGYNTVHEALACKIPSLLIPSQKPLVDDQYKRARLVEEAGYAICLQDDGIICKAVERLFDEWESMKESLESYEFSKGASQAVQHIMEYIES